MSFATALQGLGAKIGNSISQFKNDQFAKSTMAGIAFTANASQGIDPKEEEAAAEAIGNITELKVFPPEKLQGYFSDFVAMCNKSSAFGNQNCLTEVGHLKAHPEQATACVNICIVIGSMDPDPDGKNKAALVKIIHTLGLKEEDFDLSTTVKKA